MKKTYLFIIVLGILGINAVQANIQPGDTKGIATAPQEKAAVKCDVSCSDCDETTGKCTSCANKYEYPYENKCVPICTGVSCAKGTKPVSKPGECCCE